MKKIITIIFCILILTSCQSVNDNDFRLYNEMIEMIKNSDNFFNESKYFSSSFEISSTSEGFRYYIVIDNPTISMYGVSILAYEEGVDSLTFFPNAGIFDEVINIVPNQINKEKGFIKGISISGVSNNYNPTIYCLVQWKDEKNTKVFREYLKFSNQESIRE